MNSILLRNYNSVQVTVTGNDGNIYYLPAKTLTKLPEGVTYGTLPAGVVDETPEA